MVDRVRTRRTSTRFSSSPSTGSSLSPSTWGRLAGDFAPAYHEVLTPLPNYDESLNVPVLTQTYFSTPQFEGKVIPKHLREKTIGRFIQLALTILTFGTMLTDIHRYVPATLLWGHLLSMYILIATHVLDDSSSGISAKSYRWTHFVFEATASLCWCLLLIITPWTFINNVSLLVTSILIPLIWFIHLAYSGYVLFYLKNIEQDEGVFPNLVVREDGRVMPSQDIMSWLAQPRNKARLILSYLYLIINLWDSSEKGEAQVIAALNLAVCLVFCLDGAWRGKMSLGNRVLMELCYDSGINALLIVLVTASRFHHDSSYDQSIDFFIWTAVLFHLYVTGWNVNRYLSRDGRWNSMITKFVNFIDSIPFFKYVFEAGLPRQLDMFRRKNKTNTETAAIENTSDLKSKSSGDGDMAQSYEKNSVLVHDRFCPSLSSSFWLIFLFRAITITTMPFISDCDETFNYWEPLHYLQYGYGMQTWEYSPDYAIRSYAYLTLYGVPAFLLDKILEVIPFTAVHVWRRMIVFYLVRLGLCAVTAYVEANYYRAVVERVSSRVGWYLLWLLILSPGMWQASVAFLPSTFAMYTTMWCFTSLMHSYHLGRLPLNFHAAWLSIGMPILCVAFGAIWGWPFSGIVGVPLVLEEVFLRSWNGGKNAEKCLPETFQRFGMVILSSLLSLLILLTPLMGIDYLFYKKWVVVPWNIVQYNVFGKEGGSELYGTEPWWYYVVNATLNFNVAFVMALIAPAVVALSYKYAYNDIVSCMNVAYLASSAGRPYQLLTVQLVPVYLWLFVFNLQPHKEERFLYVIYPSLCYNASVAISFIRTWLSRKYSANKKFSKWPRIFSTLFFIGFTTLSIMRIAAIHLHYGSSISLYQDLFKEIQTNQTSLNNVNVCLGDEWYRFPSHYFLHDKARLLWVESGPKGLLPKYYPADKVPPSALSTNGVLDFIQQRIGTYLSVAGFNSKNQEDKSRYSDPSLCNFFITLVPHDVSPSDAEELKRTGLQRKVKSFKCLPFLDRSTPSLHRAFWLPLFFNRDEKVRWAQYCWFRVK